MIRKSRKEERGHIRHFPVIKRESLIVVTGLTLAFSVLFLMVILLSQSMLAAERLKLQNEVERSFNDLFWDFQQGSVSAQSISANEKVLGVGVYAPTGAVLYSWGKVYNRLSASSLRTEANKTGAEVLVHFDKNSGVMEYTRFLRQRVIVTGTNILMLDPDTTTINAGFEYPSIMYIAFDGSSFSRHISWLSFLAFISLVAVVLVYMFVINLYEDNKRYRQQMLRNESLVNLGQAARTLTHEIKNPLSAITIQLALMKRELTGCQLEELMVIDHESKRLVQLTNRVSDFLKNPQGIPIQIDIVALLRQLYPFFAFGVEEVKGSLGQAFVLFDEDRARSVFENILKNAMESCTGRDPQVQVEITYDKKNQYHIFIRDRGDGIKEVDKEKLFDPFYTTKIHGSGIGLSISRQFVHAQHGQIRLSSRDGGGTSVEVILPRHTLLSEIMQR